MYNFGQIVELMSLGYKVKRKNQKDVYYYYDRHLYFKNYKNIITEANFSQEDILAKDWIKY